MVHLRLIRNKDVNTTQILYQRSCKHRVHLWDTVYNHKCEIQGVTITRNNVATELIIINNNEVVIMRNKVAIWLIFVLKYELQIRERNDLR